jgi:hypothetical protein
MTGQTGITDELMVIDEMMATGEEGMATRSIDLLLLLRLAWRRRCLRQDPIGSPCPAPPRHRRTVLCRQNLYRDLCPRQNPHRDLCRNLRRAHRQCPLRVLNRWLALRFPINALPWRTFLLCRIAAKR